ncbi:MAG TPA: hypothetical protein VN426_07370 [Syntrophomonadaceae bacterium]|nr:hypothetical protein [Syntrophomonadaceae bacterium]
MKNGEEYQGTIQAQLSERRDDVNKSKSSTALSDTAQGCDFIESLHAKQALMDAKLQALRMSSDDAWDDLKKWIFGIK